MYKIIVIDDKPLIRKGIIKMINFEEHCAALVGEASDGLEAYELIKKENPDIVITDIRMPECDGLSLLKQINSDTRDIQTIVISGYDDFQYVKNAMKYGSINYILKPTDPEELNISIQKACNIIMERRRANLDNNGQFTKFFINRMNKKIIEPFEEAFSQKYLNSTFCVAVFKSYSDHIGKDEVFQAIKDQKGFEEIFVFRDGKRFISLFCASEVFALKLFEHKVYSLVSEFVQKQNSVSGDIICGIGKAVKGPEFLSNSLDTAMEAISYNIFQEYRHTVLYSNVASIPEKSFNITEFEGELLLQITSGNTKKVNEILEQILLEVFDKDISIRTLKKTVMNLCLILNKIDTGIFDEISNFIEKINNADYILTFYSLENIKELLYNLFRYTTQGYFIKSGSKESLVVRIQSFIELNYRQPLSLENIAEFFHLNPSYLSSQFKIRTKETITQYINHVRIDKAKKLLESSEVNLQHLAESIGYKDQVYFCKVFKKLTGITPGEFRNKVQKI